MDETNHTSATANHQPCQEQEAVTQIDGKGRACGGGGGGGRRPAALVGAREKVLERTGG